MSDIAKRIQELSKRQSAIYKELGKIDAELKQLRWDKWIGELNEWGKPYGLNAEQLAKFTINPKIFAHVQSHYASWDNESRSSMEKRWSVGKICTVSGISENGLLEYWCDGNSKEIPTELVLEAIGVTK
jgi:hypothetical protein